MATYQEQLAKYWLETITKQTITKPRLLTPEDFMVPEKNIIEEYITRKMTKDELNMLSDEEKKQRRHAQDRISKIKTTEKRAIRMRAYYQKNKAECIERVSKYQKTPDGKKKRIIYNWKTISYLQETDEEIERIYELYKTQELCSSCDVKLTRNGDRSPTDVTMDHDHGTNRFRHICCNSCNIGDRWRIYWVDGIFGGTKVPHGPPQ